MKPSYILRKKKGIKYFTFSHFDDAGILAAFTTRIGGVSHPPYDTLNLGSTTKDKPENVRENKRRLNEVLGVSANEIIELAHGDDIFCLDESADIKSHPKADAVITMLTETPLMITYADCVPIFIYDPVKKAIGLVHSGWRGTLKKIAEKTLQKMKTHFGCNPQNCLAGIASAIGPCCFQVDEDVANKFLITFSLGKDLVRRISNKFLIDLWQANWLQLIEGGIRDENIAVSDICTRCKGDLFFSYRRDKGDTGRMAAIISLRGG